MRPSRLSGLILLVGCLCWSVSPVVGLARVPQSLSRLTAEKDLWNRGYHYVVGTDESGTGCIAGPVVVASCVLLKHPNDDDDENNNNIYNDDEIVLKDVQDSKKMSKEMRDKVYRHVLDNPQWYAYNIRVVSPTELAKQQNTHKTIRFESRQSIQELIASSSSLHHDAERIYSIVDGKGPPLRLQVVENDPNNNIDNNNNKEEDNQQPLQRLTTRVPCRPWVGGDAAVYTVALASVLAKVTHDQLLLQAHHDYPLYGFQTNKGYPTRQHVAAIHQHGPCPLHRLHTKPLKGRTMKRQ